MIIGLDFDGTLVKHRYPEIGEDIGAFEWLREAQEKYGPTLQYVLWTVRSGENLLLAYEYCEFMGLILWGVNRNPDQWKWSGSPKAHCHMYIDDISLGTPLIHRIGQRPYVNWGNLGPMMMDGIEAYIHG